MENWISKTVITPLPLSVADIALMVPGALLFLRLAAIPVRTGIALILFEQTASFH
jgi:hypothetical protein